MGPEQQFSVKRNVKKMSGCNDNTKLNIHKSYNKEIARNTNR